MFNVYHLTTPLIFNMGYCALYMLVSNELHMQCILNIQNRLRKLASEISKNNLKFVAFGPFPFLNKFKTFSSHWKELVIVNSERFHLTGKSSWWCTECRLPYQNRYIVPKAARNTLPLLSSRKTIP